MILKIKGKSALRWVGRWVCPCFFCILNLDTRRTRGAEQQCHVAVNIVISIAHSYSLVSNPHVSSCAFTPPHQICTLLLRIDDCIHAHVHCVYSVILI